MADEGLNFEAWSMPHVGALTRKFDFSKWVESYTLNDRFNDLTDGVLTLPDDFPLASTLFHVDEANHANDVGSMIRVLRGTTPILHYLVTRSEDSWSDTEPTHKLNLEGLEWILDRCLVPNYDHPADPTVDPDWIYGADSVLYNTDFETSGITSAAFQLSIDATAGTFTVTLSAFGTSPAINWNADYTAVQTAIEAITGINDVAVSGAGTAENPFVIEFLDPSETDVGTVSANSGGLTGLASVQVITVGGQAFPDPWTRSLNPATGFFHGTYNNFEVSTVQADTGTHSLYVNGDLGNDVGSFPGAQQLVTAIGGRTYRASVRVYPEFAARYRFVIRTADETYIASVEADLTANSWQTLSLPTVLIPEHIRSVIFRVSCIANVHGVQEFFVDTAVWAPGQAAATLGKMCDDIRTAALAVGSPLTWLIPTWSTTLDSDGVAWDQERQWNVNHGQTFLQLFEYCRKWNYEFRIRWDAGDSRFEWDMWNPGAGGQTRANIAITGKSGVMGSAPIVQRPPKATYQKTEGVDGRWGEYASTTLDDTWGRLEAFYQDRQGVNSAELDVLAERLINRTQENTASRSVTVSDPSLIPWTSYEPGDIVTLNLAPKDVKKALRVAAIVVSKGPNDAAPKYDVHFGAPVYSNDTAIAQGLRTVIREFRRPTQTVRAQEGQPTLPIPPPTSVSTGIEDASWVLACYNSSVDDKIRADETLPGSSDQTAIHDAILAHVPIGGTLGILPGTILADGPLTNCDATGANTSLLFANPLRIRANGGVVWRYAANPASSNFFIRFGGSVAGTYDDPPRIIFDGITFDASDGTPGVGWTNLDGVAWYVGAGTLPPTLFTACVFRYFEGDWVFKGERHQSMQITSSFFLNCVPTDVFFYLGGFTDGNIIIHGNEFHHCSGVLDSGLGFHLGGMFYGNQIYDGTITWVGSAMHVFHNRIGGTHYTGHHQGTSGVDLNLLADAKGDIIGATAADTWARLAVGTNKHALHAASAETTGLKWQLPGGRTSISGYSRENLAASLTASQLERSLSAALSAALPVVATHAGSIVGISVASTDARTAGTATFEVYKNGSATGLTAVLDGTNTTFAFGVQAIDLDTVAAGDRLDVRVTTTGTWTPTTADVEATVVLQYDPA